MIRTFIASVVVVSLFVVCVTPAEAQRRKKKDEDFTQTLEVPPDPPAVLKVETARLTFGVAPLSAKGLLSQQVRDGIKALWKIHRKDPIVKIRAFVAGTGDQRRVQAIVAEMFSEKRLQLPVVTTVLAGALPGEGVQVVLESTALTKKSVNPHGLAFISGQGATAPINTETGKGPVLDLAKTSVENIGKALSGAGLAAGDVLRVTCLTSSLDDYGTLRGIPATQYPKAALNVVQVQRAPAGAVVECEAVARLKEPAGAPLRMITPAGLTASPNFSQVALVSAPQVVISGMQMGFRAQDSDVRLAFERLGSSLQTTGATLKNVAWSAIYPTSRAILDKVRALRFEFYDRAQPPASTVLLFEGLPSMDATFGVDVIAVP